jgi:hypothetical protein
MFHTVRIDTDLYEKLKEFSLQKHKRPSAFPTFIRDVFIEYLKKHSIENLNNS